MLDDGAAVESRKAVRRTPAERAAIVAETYHSGATVAGVAHKHGLAAAPLSMWRLNWPIASNTCGANIHIEWTYR